MKTLHFLVGFIIMCVMGLAQARPVFQTVDLSAHSKQATCGALAYLDVPERYAAIRAKPNQNAKKIAKLRNRQYLCVVNNNADNSDWLVVKAVPFLGGKNTLCERPSDYPQNMDYKNSLCGQTANYPVVWLSKKHPSTKTCRLEEKTDEESIVWITRGTCATGWLPAKSVHYFAD